LAFTGLNALLLGLIGLALLVAGALLYWWARKREHCAAGEIPSAP
jgi:LPXTG-motif cell wall-anchored protein